MFSVGTAEGSLNFADRRERPLTPKEPVPVVGCGARSCPPLRRAVWSLPWALSPRRVASPRTGAASRSSTGRKTRQTATPLTTRKAPPLHVKTTTTKTTARFYHAVNNTHRNNFRNQIWTCFLKKKLSWRTGYHWTRRKIKIMNFSLVWKNVDGLLSCSDAMKFTSGENSSTPVCCFALFVSHSMSRCFRRSIFMGPDGTHFVTEGTVIFCSARYLRAHATYHSHNTSGVSTTGGICKAVSRKKTSRHLALNVFAAHYIIFSSYPGKASINCSIETHPSIVGIYYSPVPQIYTLSHFFVKTPRVIYRVCSQPTNAVTTSKNDRFPCIPRPFSWCCLGLSQWVFLIPVQVGRQPPSPSFSFSWPQAPNPRWIWRKVALLHARFLEHNISSAPKTIERHLTSVLSHLRNNRKEKIHTRCEIFHLLWRCVLREAALFVLLGFSRAHSFLPHQNSSTVCTSTHSLAPANKHMTNRKTLLLPKSSDASSAYASSTVSARNMSLFLLERLCAKIEITHFPPSRPDSRESTFILLQSKSPTPNHCAFCDLTLKASSDLLARKWRAPLWLRDQIFLLEEFLSSDAQSPSDVQAQTLVQQLLLFGNQLLVARIYTPME